MFLYKNKELNTLLRLFFKISFGFVAIIAIFFLHVEEVNLPKQPLTDKNYLVDVNHEKINKIKIKKQTTQIIPKKKKVPLWEKKQYLLVVVKDALDKKHFSPVEADAYEKICNYYPARCDKIDISDEFTYQQRVYYLALSMYLFNFVNHFVDLKKNLFYVKVQPEKIGRRGYAGHHSIIINVKKNMSYEQFFEVLTHEVGHVVDLGVLTGHGVIKNKFFTEYGKPAFYNNDPSLKFYSLCWKSEKVKKPDVYISDFVSGYGMTDPFEDFAESFNMYLNHNYVFIQMATESNILRQKYNFFAKLFKGNYIHSDRNYDYKSGFRPRDSTSFSE